MTRHLAFKDAPRLWRTIGPGIRVRVICPDARPRRTPRPRGIPTSAAVVCERICNATGISWGDVVAGKRRADVVRTRAAIAYWLRRRTGLSYPAIARLLGNRHHTTILYAVRGYPARRAMEGRCLTVVASH